MNKNKKIPKKKIEFLFIVVPMSITIALNCPLTLLIATKEKFFVEKKVIITSKKE